MRRYIRSLKRQASEKTGDADLFRRELVSVEQKISNATAAILDGGLDKSNVLADALKDLEAQKEQLLGRLSSTTVPELDTLPDIVPRAIERYRNEVERMEQLGASPKPEHVVRRARRYAHFWGNFGCSPTGTIWLPTLSCKTKHWL